MSVHTCHDYNYYMGLSVQDPHGRPNISELVKRPRHNNHYIKMSTVVTKTVYLGQRKSTTEAFMINGERNNLPPLLLSWV